MKTYLDLLDVRYRGGGREGGREGGRVSICRY